MDEIFNVGEAILLDGQMKYRCLYEKDGADVQFVLVNSPNSGDGRVILFDSLPASVQ